MGCFARSPSAWLCPLSRQKQTHRPKGATLKPSAQTLKKTAIATAVVLAIALLGVQAALLWELRSTEVEVLNPVDGVTVLNPEVTVLNPGVRVLNPVDEVTVLNPVDEVMVLNPVERVSISGDVSVSGIDSAVQAAVPWSGSRLYGHCSLRGNQYSVSIKVLAGGVERVVAEGNYSGDITSLIGEYAVLYYRPGSSGLNFGDSSEDCSGLRGWL